MDWMQLWQQLQSNPAFMAAFPMGGAAGHAASTTMGQQAMSGIGSGMQQAGQWFGNAVSNPQAYRGFARDLGMPEPSAFPYGGGY